MEGSKTIYSWKPEVLCHIYEKAQPCGLSAMKAALAKKINRILATLIS